MVAGVQEIQFTQVILWLRLFLIVGKRGGKVCLLYKQETTSYNLDLWFFLDFAFDRNFVSLSALRQRKTLQD